MSRQADLENLATQGAIICGAETAAFEESQAYTCEAAEEIFRKAGASEQAALILSLALSLGFMLIADCALVADRQ